ncbi:hypothetical protein DW66_3120 [Pseudomonas putida]|nr:hypothetical protein DW66_3120 [Pseudomonas putida]
MLRGRKQLTGTHAKPRAGHCDHRDQGQGLAQKVPARIVGGMLRHCESSSAVCGLEKRHLIFNMGGS